MSVCSEAPELLTLYPGEDFVFDFVFDNRLAAGASILSSPVPTITSEVVTGGGAPSFGAPAVSGGTVQVKIAQGTATVPSRFLVQCKARDSLGNDFIVAGLLDVVAPATEPEDC